MGEKRERIVHMRGSVDVCMYVLESVVQILLESDTNFFECVIGTSFLK